MARSEYSRLRGIAQKRIERLEARGLGSAGISFPKVSELKTPGEKSAALEALKTFLSSGTTIKEARQHPEKKLVLQDQKPAFLTEKQIRDQQRRDARNARRRERYAQNKAARDARNARRRERYRRNKIINNLNDKQRALLKGAETLGLNIPTDRITQFIEYMEYRFSQVNESAYYLMDKYVEDYQQIMKNSPTVDDISADFARFVSERNNNENLFNTSNSYNEDAVHNLWSQYADSLR